MIEIRYTRSENDHWFNLKGHAGYANSGSDIVCAGVSAIFIALCDKVSDMAMKRQCTYGYMDDGETRKLHIHSISGVDDIIDMANRGFQFIAEEYPDYVKIK